MRPATTRPLAASTLYLAFELGNTEWKLAMTTRIDQAPLVRTISARALTTLDAEIIRAQAHFGVPASAPVCTCYEAGRDGFWLHRDLGQRGIATASSIRRALKSIAANGGRRPIASTRASW